MESSEEPTSLQSICHLRASELFPKHTHFECDDPTLTVPFTPLSGESVVALGCTSDGVLALSNYRLYLQLSQACYNIPLGLIEQLEVKEIFYLHIGCKDARSLSCAFSTNEHCLEWFKRLHKVTYPRKSIEDIFAFAYYAWSVEEGRDYPRLGKDNGSYTATFNSEVERLKFNLHGTWRVSQINADYRMCPSYPPQLLVPACILDETLETVAKFRSSRRIPAVVWRHINNGAVIARSSQPEVGWLGWRSTQDEDLLKALSDACSYDRGESTMIDSPTSYSDVSEESITSSTTKKVLIVDARSYTTAVANRARGGGCECPEYYPSCDIQFMNLPNIHSIRKSFHAVRQLCASDADQPNWLSLLEGTRWLQHMSGLLRAAVTVASAIERDGRPVLVHCSDGWDRTPQIVALAQLLLDPYYRTMEGFQVLCEREWLDFGHKFADRCGQTVGCEDPNERCPVFLQWLDCVHQLILQFSCSFQMSPAYLVKLAQHTYSQLFGTFLCNTRQERLQLRIRERTFSVWRFLNSNSFVNHLYSPQKDQVLWPSCNVRDLVLWSEVYLGSTESSLGNSNDKQRVTMIDIEGGDSEEPQGQMTKTRSYGDLIHVQDHVAYLHRRLSDPSISIEKKFDSLNIDNEVEKIEENTNEIRIPEVNGDDTPEKAAEKNRYTTNEVSSDSPANPSVDSSTDTIIPNIDLTVDVVNGEKDMLQTIQPQDVVVSPWTETGVAGRGGCTCNRVHHEGSDAGRRRRTAHHSHRCSAARTTDHCRTQAQGGSIAKGITHDKAGSDQTCLQPQRRHRSYRRHWFVTGFCGECRGPRRVSTFRHVVGSCRGSWTRTNSVGTGSRSEPLHGMRYRILAGKAQTSLQMLRQNLLRGLLRELDSTPQRTAVQSRSSMQRLLLASPSSHESLPVQFTSAEPEQRKRERDGCAAAEFGRCTDVSEVEGLLHGKRDL
ncbi:myotubularin-related protein 3 isoform X2 [Cephus cinctus]|uniref:Myotubularin-related protein 3 isoform X2 n=1 Tax=Cephus cinctus TaxID=211228 RepID=A0AAJ7BQR2_CEPCN|nr:myotubularin-related protein 3 isoform X2 [Cephus cinctus]